MFICCSKSKKDLKELIESPNIAQVLLFKFDFY